MVGNRRQLLSPIQYWKLNEKRLPLLASLSKRHMAIPSTSATVERLFSIAWKIVRPERCSLSDDNFETLMMIKCNSES